MVLGVDTGFFINRNKHPRASQIWQEFVEGNHFLIVSTLTLNEMFSYFHKRDAIAFARESLALMQTMPQIELIPVSVEIAILSARYRLGMQLATVDSIILATFLVRGCEKMISSDRDFAIVAQQKVLPVEILN